MFSRKKEKEPKFELQSQKFIQSQKMKLDQQSNDLDHAAFDQRGH